MHMPLSPQLHKGDVFRGRVEIFTKRRPIVSNPKATTRDFWPLKRYEEQAAAGRGKLIKVRLFTFMLWALLLLLNVISVSVVCH